MNSDEIRDLWKSRITAIGQAQARYLWSLLLVGVFFWALQGRTGPSPAIPGLGLDLDFRVLQGVGPVAIFLLIIVTHGTLRAHGEALRQLGLPRDPRVPLSEEDRLFSEAVDASPNPLDFAFYTRRKWTRSPWALLLLNYPLYFGFFMAEAIYLWLSLVKSEDLATFTILGALLGATAFIQTVILTWARIRRIWAIWTKTEASDGPSSSSA